MIVVTDRTVLDAQLQDTIYQFEHTDGVVGRINREEGDGSKSEKLASALQSSQPIIIVTSDFHTPRAAAIAKKQGYSNFTMLGSTTPISTRYNAWLREYFAYVSGWLLNEY